MDVVMTIVTIYVDNCVDEYEFWFRGNLEGFK